MFVHMKHIRLFNENEKTSIQEVKDILRSKMDIPFINYMEYLLTRYSDRGIGISINVLFFDEGRIHIIYKDGKWASSINVSMDKLNKFDNSMVEYDISVVSGDFTKCREIAKEIVDKINNKYNKYIVNTVNYADGDDMCTIALMIAKKL